MRLAGKVAIVVGAGQQPGSTIGNGRATALRFAQEGATLLLVDTNADWVEETCELVRGEGATASVLVADVTDEDACRVIAETCLARHGRIDVLHNNVGRFRGDTNTTSLNAEVWDAIMATNLKAMFMTSKHALPAMRAQGTGAIVNVSSTSSLVGGRTLAYKTSKGGVNTLTQHLAFENAPFGVRANAILPGLMDTPMAVGGRAAESGIDEEAMRAQRHAQVPLSARMGTAWDVANAALFLASDEAQYITGVLLPVEGGLLLKTG
ncbi:MAG: SDR family NAD(P)-dependent oxidoreductase [Methyloligellaceae bacterium]